MKNEIAEIIQQQIDKEFYSSYLYLQIGSWYEKHGLSGFANWFTIQAKEELDHAMKFIAYLQESDVYVELGAIEKPEPKIEQPMDGLKMALAHEKYITASINDIYELAQNFKDYRTTNILTWFIIEQGEEEKNASELISKMDMFGQDGRGLYMLDKELGARVYNAPQTEAK